MTIRRLPPFLQIFFVLAFLVGWEGYFRFQSVDPLIRTIIASPSDSIVALAAALGVGRLTEHFLTTFYELGVAYGLAISLGLGVGFLVGGIRYLGRFIDPLVMAAFSIPKITIYPLFMLWFGIGVDSKIAYGAFAGVFPILINLMAGLREIEPHLLTLARAMGASAADLYWKVVLPAVTPVIFAGLRLALIITSVSVIVAEMVLATRGIGFLIFNLAYTGSPERVAELYGVLIVLSIVLIAANQSLLKGEKWQIRYRL